jgi:hypothetical protein
MQAVLTPIPKISSANSMPVVPQPDGGQRSSSTSESNTTEFHNLTTTTISTAATTARPTTTSATTISTISSQRQRLSQIRTTTDFTRTHTSHRKPGIPQNKNNLQHKSRPPQLRTQSRPNSPRRSNSTSSNNNNNYNKHSNHHNQKPMLHKNPPQQPPSIQRERVKSQNLHTLLHSLSPTVPKRKGYTVHDIFQYFDEPYGHEVPIDVNGHSTICVFVPNISALQLYRKVPQVQLDGSIELESGERGGLVFEFFEELGPHLRSPMLEKIDSLAEANAAVFALPCGELDLSRSWFCVGWYPVLHEHLTSAEIRGAFLTYHSFEEVSCEANPPRNLLQPVVVPSDESGESISSSSSPTSMQGRNLRDSSSVSNTDPATCCHCATAAVAGHVPCIGELGTYFGLLGFVADRVMEHIWFEMPQVGQSVCQCRLLVLLKTAQSNPESLPAFLSAKPTPQDTKLLETAEVPETEVVVEVDAPNVPYDLDTKQVLRTLLNGTCYHPRVTHLQLEHVTDLLSLNGVAHPDLNHTRRRLGQRFMSTPSYASEYN